MTAEKIQEIREKINKAQQDRIKAQTQIEQIEKRLKEEFECDSISAAEEFLKTSEQQVETLTEKMRVLEKQIEEYLKGIEA